MIGYERAVITSFAEVETQLASFVRQQEQLEQAEAQRNLYVVEQGVLQLRAELLSTQIGVYRALGGGLSMDSLNTPPQEYSIR